MGLRDDQQRVLVIGLFNTRLQKKANEEIPQHLQAHNIQTDNLLKLHVLDPKAFNQRREDSLYASQ